VGYPREARLTRDHFLAPHGLAIAALSSPAAMLASLVSWNASSGALDHLGADKQWASYKGRTRYFGKQSFVVLKYY